MNLREPAKWELEEFAKLAGMTDFLAGEYHPFVAIAKEAVRRKIIKSNEVKRMYSCFRVCNGPIDVFDKHFSPSDQTRTGHDRWEWKLKEGVTKEIFLEKVKNYKGYYFNTPMFSRPG
jgi:hypothetical protein